MHECAHGVSIHKKNIDKLISYANEELKDINFNEGVYEIDFIRNSNAPDLKDLINELGKYSYLWGQGIEEPLICIENIHLEKSDIQLIGTSKDTLKFEKNGIVFIQFKAKKLIERLENHNSINATVIGRANLNNWMGKTSPQIIIEDYNIEEASIFDF